MKTFKHKMIIAFALGLIMMAGTLQTKSQSAAFGIRFMPTLSSMEMKTSAGGTVTGQVALGFGFGGFLGFYFSDYAGAQGELIYSSVNQKYMDQEVERKINLQYINIPLLVSLNTGKVKQVNFNIVAGPQIGINVGSNVFSSGFDTTNAVISVRAADLGFAYGAGFDFGINETRTFRVGIGYRGVLGLFDISNTSQSLATNSFYIIDRTHLKTHSVYIGISYLFR